MATRTFRSKQAITWRKTMQKKKNKNKLKKNKSNFLENMAFSIYDLYSPNKKEQLCTSILKKSWSRMTSIELNKLIFFGYTTERLTTHYKITPHQLMDKLRRETNIVNDKPRHHKRKRR